MSGDLKLEQEKQFTTPFDCSNETQSGVVTKYQALNVTTHKRGMSRLNVDKAFESKKQCASEGAEFSVVCRLNERQMFIQTAYCERQVLDIP